MSGRADSAASFVARCHGQQPSISVSSEKLRKVRISTIAASSPTLSNVKGAVMVEIMSAPTNNSSPSRMPRPISEL